MRYTATFELLPRQRAVIVELADSDGEWSGGQRVDLRRGGTSADLYEAGYRAACQAAAVKGGTLDAYRPFA